MLNKLYLKKYLASTNKFCLPSLKLQQTQLGRILADDIPRILNRKNNL